MYIAHSSTIPGQLRDELKREEEDFFVSTVEKNNIFFSFGNDTENQSQFKSMKNHWLINIRSAMSQSKQN